MNRRSSAARLGRLASCFVLSMYSGHAWADPPSCNSPQDAARSLVDRLQPDRWEPQLAWQCLDLPPATTPAEAETLAIQLKKVLDARGLLVPVSDLSLDANYQNANGGYQVSPIPAWPALSIERLPDGRWVYARALVQATPRLYHETFSAVPGWIQRHIPAWIEGPHAGLYTWQWVYLCALSFVALLAGVVAQRVVSERFLRVARRGRIELRQDVIDGTRIPLTVFAVGLVALWGIADLQLSVQTSRVLLFLATGATSLSVVLIAARIVDIVADFFARRAEATPSKLDDQVIPLASRAAKTAIWILGIVVVIQNLGVDVTGLVAGVGVGSLAFALAAQDTVENLFGSVTIFTDRPFQIGDWVIIDGNIEGVVEEVGFRSTRIRTFTSSVVSVPNAKVANSTVDNMGQRRFRRVKATIGLTYGTPPDRLHQFVCRIREMLAQHPKVAPTTCEVHFVNFGASSLDIQMYFFLNVADWSEELDVRGRIYYEVMKIAEDTGVSFAFPSMSVYVERPTGVPTA